MKTQWYCRFASIKNKATRLAGLCLLNICRSTRACAWAATAICVQQIFSHMRLRFALKIVHDMVICSQGEHLTKPGGCCQSRDQTLTLDLKLHFFQFHLLLSMVHQVNLTYWQCWVSFCFPARQWCRQLAQSYTQSEMCGKKKTLQNIHPLIKPKLTRWAKAKVLRSDCNAFM